MTASSRSLTVLRWIDAGAAVAQDLVAVEEPLEIRIGRANEPATAARSVSITMRTPGHDHELAVGFLVSEGLLRQRDHLFAVAGCGPLRPDGTQNVVRVVFADGHLPDLARLDRHFYTSSSCGVCGKASLAALALQDPPTLAPAPGSVDPALLAGLPARLRAAQPTFDQTGGVHATGLVDPEGALRWVREDVGRHNAFDKAVGAALLEGCLPLTGFVAVVSGRVSFELVQKAVMAGIATVVGVGAPSSLAVELAAERGILLVAFVREGRFNVYSGAERLNQAPRSATVQRSSTPEPS